MSSAVVAASVVVTSYSGGGGWHNSGNHGYGVEADYAYQPWSSAGWPYDQAVATVWTLTLKTAPGGAVVATRTGSATLVQNSKYGDVSEVFSDLAPGKYILTLSIVASEFTNAGKVYQPATVVQEHPFTIA